MPTTPNNNPASESNEPPQPLLEMAYVLFMDIVGYSRLATDTQQQAIDNLKRMVRETPEFQRASAAHSLIGLPTGDGMALAFFGDPQSAVQCALEVSRSLRTCPQIPVRMGMHAGPVFRVRDILGNENVAGDGINMAQRVMDCGDGGHLLISKSLADILRQLSGWQGSLFDLGVVAVKHGVLVHVYNLLIDGVGNAEPPKKFKKRPLLTLSKGAQLAIFACIAALSVATILVFVFRAKLFPSLFRKPTVAVLGFYNSRQTPGTEWAATLLAERLSTELEAGDNLHAVPGENIAQAQREMALPEGVTFGADTLARLHKRLHCDYVLYGSMDDEGPAMGARVHLDVHMQNVSTGEMMSLAEAGSESKLSDLASRVGASLRSRLSVPAITTADSKRVDAAVPAGQAAQKAYFDGLRQLRSFDLLAARDSFQASIAADGSFPLSHAYLAEVWSGLGYDDRSKTEAKTAFDLSGNLLREYQILAEARYRESISEWDNAVELYRTLWNFAPDDPEYALRAASVQVRAGRGSDALATVADLRKRAPDAADDPRIDLREAEAHESLGDPRREANAAKRAVDKAHASGARLLEAEALWRVCDGLRVVGDTGGAATACNSSIELAKAGGAQLLVARAQSNLGNIYAAQGDPAKALTFHQRALQIARELGSQRDVAGALGNIGDCLSSEGDHPGAIKNYLEGLQVAAETNNRPALLLLQNDIAAEKQSLGDFSSALDYYEKSLATALAIGDQAGQVDAASNLAALELLRGDLSSALKNIQQAVQLSDQLGMKSKSALIRNILGDVLWAQGNLDDAEKTYMEALQTSQKLADKAGAANAQLSLANLAVEREHWPDAVQLAQQATAEFTAENNVDMASSADLVLADASYGQKKYSEAQAALQQAQSLKSSDPAIQLSAALTSARILACTGKLAAAEKQVSEVAKRAQQSGLLFFQLRASLVSGEFALCAAPSPRSRALLHSLQLEAGGKGYHAIEQQAGRVLAQLR